MNSEMCDKCKEGKEICREREQHVHEILGSTLLGNCCREPHNHRFATVSGEAIKSGTSHYHNVKFRTDSYEGHYHEFEGKTGPAISVNLGFSLVTYVKEILKNENGFATVKKEVEDGVEILEVKLPAVLCMLKCDYEPRRPLIEGFKVAQNVEIPYYSIDNIGLQPENVGIKGSPTCVSKAFRPEQKQSGEIFENITTDVAVEKILEVLNG